MPPAVALTGPEETLTIINPFEVATTQTRLVPIDITPGNVHPRIIFFGEHRPHFSSAHITEHDNVRVLQTIQLLDNDLVRVRSPLHAWQIVVARIPGHIEPLSCTAFCRDNSDASC